MIFEVEIFLALSWLTPRLERRGSWGPWCRRNVFCVGICVEKFPIDRKIVGRYEDLKSADGFFAVVFAVVHLSSFLSELWLPCQLRDREVP